MRVLSNEEMENWSMGKEATPKRITWERCGSPIPLSVFAVFLTCPLGVRELETVCPSPQFCSIPRPLPAGASLRRP